MHCHCMQIRWFFYFSVGFSVKMQISSVTLFFLGLRAVQRTKLCRHSEKIVLEIAGKFQEGFDHQLNFLASRMDHLCTRGNAEQLQHGFVAVLSTEVFWVGPLLITLGSAESGMGGTKIIYWLRARSNWGCISFWICLGWVYTRISGCALGVY